MAKIKQQQNTFKSAHATLWKALWFFLKLNVFALPLYALLFFNVRFTILEEFTANLVTAMLHLAGANPTQTGTFIAIPIPDGSWGAFITPDCTGWKSMLAFIALVFATDAPRKKQLFGLLLLPVIALANIVRIVFVFLYVQHAGLASYSLVHDVLWSWGLILIILCCWIIWMKTDVPSISCLQNPPQKTL